ncbi:hypothetical protein PIROE2DRAFT_58579 [Piromyces sp. E2]|nr:hypothetical protein PIROE2DRAFT_58579 [Piromyces sp. E2]|eukprot:OUM67708.1 hypothetical protein PIROE2DRAFT_58579 [Piromyces sp. E2]
MSEESNNDESNPKTNSFSDLINKNNPKIIGSNIENLLWGFNPNELLNEITFPNEKEEFLIRRVKKIRTLTVKGINLLDKEIDFFLECFDKKIYYPLLDFILSLEYAKCKNNTDDHSKELQVFLSRSAASIVIQTHWRMYNTRKKYFMVMYGELSFITNTNSTERDPHMPYLPPVTDLSVQEKLIQKYKKFCQYYEDKGYLPPDFPQYCAVLIQKHFKRYICQMYYKKLKSLVN